MGVQGRQASISYHETEMGQLPFLFVGEAAQEFASCKEIVYPDYRTALGWMCKGKVDVPAVGDPDADTAVNTGFTALSAVMLAVLVAVALL